jgi:hypothetical protein
MVLGAAAMKDGCTESPRKPTSRLLGDSRHNQLLPRVNAGIARAKADGKHCGRPFIDSKLEERIRQALAAPGRAGVHKLAKQFGVGSGTVQRIARAE